MDWQFQLFVATALLIIAGASALVGELTSYWFAPIVFVVIVGAIVLWAISLGLGRR